MYTTDMKFQVCVIAYLIVSSDTLSLQKVSDKNVTKRAANSDFFPNWVPFKNKHGDELGEFVQVEPKKKLKKRLALPINFKLRAVAEPEGDDYYDKGQGESDDGDEYEKKEWSDLNRQAEPVNPDQPINHTDISDIDGVVNIITQVKPNLIGLITNKNKENKEIDISTEADSENKEEQSTEDQELDSEKPEKSIEKYQISVKEAKNEEKAKAHKKEHKYEDDIEYEDSISEKQKPDLTEEERIENEAKKAIILDAVDELKARHEEEQRAISEKVKEEEIYKEEHERNKLQSSEEKDKYGGKKTKHLPDYDEYDDNSPESLYDKYKINVEKASTKTSTSTEPTSRKTSTSRRRKQNKNKESGGKMSVFKNPRLYMVYDDEAEESVTKESTTKSPKESRKYSSRYSESSPKDSDENVRISLVPQNGDLTDEPTLFFPQKRKNKRRRKNKSTTTPSPDSSVAETVEDKTSNVDTTAELTDTTAFTTDTVTTGSDAVSTNSDTITDAVPASTDKKEEKKNDNYDQEKGGARQYKADHFEEHHETGKKAYEHHPTALQKSKWIHFANQMSKVKTAKPKLWYCYYCVDGVHDETKTAKGHHDKEDHSGEYKDRAGIDKEHHDESKHYGAHHHEEHGKKHAKYEESGKHSKGHSTKGSHDIHKKEEYEKRVEFFEEEGDSAEEEKHGGYNHEREHSKGGNYKQGSHESHHDSHAKGDKGHHAKGGQWHGHKGHKVAGGHDSHGRHHQAHHQKEGHNSGKKWVYHHGHPAKTANLVLIDRRADQYQHGPQYYG